MVHFAGLDVSVKATSVCVIDDAGEVVWEQEVPIEPADIIAVSDLDVLSEFSEPGNSVCEACSSRDARQHLGIDQCGVQAWLLGRECGQSALAAPQY